MFRFFSDPALTAPLTSLPLANLVGAGPVPAVIYFGNPVAGTVLSGDPITVSVVDAQTGSGLPATAVRVALSEGDLESAGQSVSLGATLLAGVDGAVAIWLLADTGAAAAGWYTDLTITTSLVVESTP